MTSAVLWLLNYQTQEGAFVETNAYAESPFHRPMTPGYAEEGYGYEIKCKLAERNCRNKM